MPRFPLGQLLATPAVVELLAEVGVAPLELIARHARGDWGDLGEEDKQANEEALETGARLFSAYRLTDELKFWVITEAADSDGARLATTILLPSEY